MATKQIRRWSDDDRHFGPFTYSGDSRTSRWGIMLGSGDGDDYPGAFLRFHAAKHTLIVAIPAIIKPARVWVDTSRSSWNVVGGGYWDTHRREYGFTISEGAVHVHHGQQTMDSTTDQSKCWFIPWTQWRNVRSSMYGLDGEHFWTEPRGVKWDWDWRRAAQAACPAARFEFDDFDGERITATTRIEEREWWFGTGHFTWLSLLSRPRIARSLAIEFGKETGSQKGSWKGGVTAHSIDMLPGEHHEGAFRRYCLAHKMTFVGRVA